MAVTTLKLIPVPDGARKADLTPQGLFKILKRTGSLIRDDGRWYCDPDVVDRVIEARRVLGIDRSTRGVHRSDAHHAVEKLSAHIAQIGAEAGRVEKLHVRSASPRENDLDQLHRGRVITY